MPPFPLENTPLNNPATEPTNQFSLPPVRQVANLNYFFFHLPTHLLHFGFPLCLKKKKRNQNKKKPQPPKKPQNYQKTCSTYFY